MRILISKTTSGILIQRDELDLQVDAPAIAIALPAIFATLLDSGRAVGQARREGLEDGLILGRERARIEAATSERIAERQAAELVESLICTALASAA